MAEKASAPAVAGGKSWTHSFWDCFSPIDTCLCGTFLPCFLYGRTHARLTDPNLEKHSDVNGSCCGFCLLAYCGCAGILQAIQRGKIRDAHGIEGNGCMDFVSSCCCPCCSVIQSEKEVVARQQVAASGGYQPTQGMAYQQ
ncbi:hypothetical protein AJ80_07627 [Polytolypa hystricis UAMH7299]|uniref:Uncharacterized protein n=1 Tax=Polytolypa hystricis (strain UAMH7299) TaxID=1447883 RepID=A0A2B7XLU1_POLH7|nr:hypothetical protein AJ80_07627 [Polytolypa hystricis UAMH7299]